MNEKGGWEGKKEKNGSRSWQFGDFGYTLIGNNCTLIGKTAHLPIYPLLLDFYR
jgi:hypothetical protein